MRHIVINKAYLCTFRKVNMSTFKELGIHQDYIKGLKENLNYDISQMMYVGPHLFTSEIGQIINIFK